MSLSCPFGHSADVLSSRRFAGFGLRLRVILRSPELLCEGTAGGWARGRRMSCVTALAARVASLPGRTSPGRFEVGYPARSGEPPDHDDGGGRFDAAVEAEPGQGGRPGDHRRADSDPGHRHGRAPGREARSGVLLRGAVRPYSRLAALRVNGSSAACRTPGA